MNKTKNKVEYSCPFCEKTHEVEVRRHMTSAPIKGQIVNYIKESYYCPIEDDEFLPAKVLDDNLLKIRDAYREKNGLLTADEIKEIRSIYGLSQKEYANLLGLGDITVQRYEKKSIQDSTYDMIMRLTKDNPNYCLIMLEKNRNNFNTSRYIEIYNAITKRIKLYGEDYIVRQSIQMKYIGFNDESENNGYAALDIDKTGIIMNYVAHYVDNLYKVKMMKLLWYIDQVSYKKYGRAMTGLVYKHMQLGALPIAHYELMKLSSICVEEEESDEYVSYKITPSREIAVTELSFEEISIIQAVLEKFRNYSTKDIVAYMHREKVYKSTEIGEILAYKEENKISDWA